MSRPRMARVMGLTAALVLLAVSAATAQMVSGSYSGNGADNRLIGTGFQPDFVMVKNTSADDGMFRTSTMPSDASKRATGAQGLATNRIQSFDPIGFRVGTDPDVNESGKTYHWMAFRALAGEIKAGSYTGNGADNRAITAVGFSPDTLFIIPAGTAEAIFKVRSTVVPEAFSFLDAFGNTTWIKTLDSDGFTVGTDSRVNASGTVYHWVAWNDVSDKIDSGHYDGNTSDSRVITLPNFRPEACLVRKQGGHHTVWHPDSLGASNDSTLFFDQQAPLSNRIQELLATGFEVGNDPDVNWPNIRYVYTCWKKVPPTAVDLISFSAVRSTDGPTVLTWRTGFEVNNLGFHIYRQVDGNRVRLTRGLIAGSGLTVGSRTALTSGQSYQWSAAGVDGSVAASYWLQDVDFSGKSTWHGPFDSIPGTSPESAASPLLSALSAGDDARVPVTRPAGASANTVTSVERQKVLAASLAVKIGISGDGWYRVTRAALEAAGLPAGSDGTRLQIYADGVEQALRVTGSPWDGVEFFGRGGDTEYTDTRVYWLVVGSTLGARVEVVDGTGTGAAGTQTFAATVTRRDRTVYFAALHNGEAANWFGPVVGTDSTTQLLTVGPVGAGAAQLTVVLRGITTETTHRVQVALNNATLGEVVFADQDEGRATFAVASADLSAGVQGVTLTARNGETDLSLIDSVALTYPHTLVAEQNALWFTATGGTRVTVSGFTGSGVRVMDVTAPDAVVELTPAAAPGQVTVAVPAAGVRTLLALGPGVALAPAWVRANAPSTLTSERLLTWVMIGPRELLNAASTLVDLRRTQGYRVAAVDVEDVYDEFSFGVKSPQAIKDYLNISAAPGAASIVLLGDGTIDPRNYVGGGAGDVMPAKFVSTTLLETASDDWYGDVNNDGIPELAIGRLPARTAAQAAAMASKIAAYERGAAGEWTKQILFVADASDESGNFEEMTGKLGSLLPGGYATQTVARGTVGTPNARTAVLNGFNAGQLIVNYLGHGSVEVWANDLLTRSDAAGLTNAARLPFVVTMNCLNGYYQGAAPEESLAEALLRSSGGAVAVWASSTLTDPYGQAGVNAELYRMLFSGRAPTLGQAIVWTKASVGTDDLRRGWVFFGDPATRLPGLPQTVTGVPGLGEIPGVTPGSLPGGVTPGGPAEIAGTGPVKPASRLVDFNADGQADLLLVNAASGRYRIELAGQGSPNAPQGQWPIGATVQPLELTGDTAADVLLYDPAVGQWWQGRNAGDGTFTYTTGSWPAGWTLRTGDFEGDGRDDALLYSPVSGKWAIAQSDGAGGFTYRRGLWSPDSEVIVARFNADTLADVLLYNRTTGAWQEATNDGVGGFSYQKGQWSTELTVVVADLDGNARDDLFLYQRATGAWTTAVADALGGFDYMQGTWAPGWQLTSGDFNGDRVDDLLVYDSVGGSWMTVLSGQAGAKTYPGGQWLPGMSVAVGDVNGDGRADIFLHQTATGAWSRQLTRVTGTFDEATGVLPASWAPVGR